MTRGDGAGSRRSDARAAGRRRPVDARCSEPLRSKIAVRLRSRRARRRAVSGGSCRRATKKSPSTSDPSSRVRARARASDESRRRWPSRRGGSDSKSCFHDERAKAHVAANPIARSTRSTPPRARRTRRARRRRRRASPSCTGQRRRARPPARGEDRPMARERHAERLANGDSTRGGRVRGRGARRRRRRTPASATPSRRRRRARVAKGGDPVVEAAGVRDRRRLLDIAPGPIASAARVAPGDSPSDRSGCIRRASGM